MKVFKFYTKEYYYGYSGETEQQARDLFIEEHGDIEIIKVEEVSEQEMDEESIKIFEDNDQENESFMVSIRSEIQNEPSLVFTNDWSYLS
jgi:predicted transposase YbfD/YdcC